MKDTSIFSGISTAAIAALMGLTACASSPPTQFYSLEASAPQSSAPQSDSAAGSHPAPLRVAAVHIPPALDRREIVRVGADARLEISGEHRWGAPFDEMVQHVLTQDLVERLPADQVVLPLGPALTDMQSVVIDLLQFQRNAGGNVVLQGSWSLLVPGQSSPSLVRPFHYEEPAGAQSFTDDAAAMSRLLGRLADDIAGEARTRRSSP